MIGFYLHHQGAGHRVRGTAIARQVHGPVTGAGTGPAPPDWPGSWVELTPDDDPPVVDRISRDVSAQGVLHWAPVHQRGLLARQRELVGWLADQQPQVVLVDVSVETALQVRLCGVPVVVTALPGERTDRAHRTAYDLATRLLAPWPEGTHDIGWPDAWRARTVHVGGISRFAGRDAGPSSDAGRVLVVWGSGGGGVDERRLAEAREQTPGWEWVVRGGGHPESADLWADLQAASVVVTHAGQNAVADVAAARRPAVVIAQERPYGEQLATARAVGQLGAAQVLGRWPAGALWPALLEAAVQRGGAGWRAWDGGGAPQAAALLEQLARSSP